MKKTYFYYLLLLVFLCACHGSPMKKEDLQAANALVAKPANVNQIVGIGRIEPEGKIISLAVNSGGIITQINKKEGDNVAIGETLISLDNAVELAKIAQINSKIATQNEQIKFAESIIKQTEIQRDNRKSYYQRMKSLYEQNAETRQRFEDAQAEYLTQESKLELNKVELSLAKSKIIETEKELATAKAELEKKTTKSSLSGQILEVLVQKGSAVEPLSTFAKFAPNGKTIAVCEIDELFADKIQAGQVADIRLIGNEQILTSGKVMGNLATSEPVIFGSFRLLLAILFQSSALAFNQAKT